MKISTHLTFNGQCEEAFAFYEKCFGGAILTKMTYGESPMASQVPAEWHSRVMHITLKLGEGTVMGADVPAERYGKPQGFFAVLEPADPADAERIFKALAENGNVTMPLQETHWAVRFGIVTDRFGIPWEMNCGRPQ